MTLNYACVSGIVKLVLYDDRDDSRTKGELQVLFLGDSNYVLVKVAPGIWNGFKGVGITPAIVANCATLPHDPEEIVRLDPSASRIPYNWAVRNE
jgi:dTDP-4-dehydrorhamnose 3,5-epimerase